MTRDVFRLMSNESLRFYAFDPKVRSASKRAAAKAELDRRDLIVGLGEEEAREIERLWLDETATPRGLDWLMHA